MSETSPQPDAPSVAPDGSTAHLTLSNAVEHFLGTTGYADMADRVEEAVLRTRHDYHQMGTMNFKDLAMAVKTHGHANRKVYKPRPCIPKTVQFLMDENSVESLDQIRKRTGMEFVAVFVTDPETSLRKEILIPVSP